MNKLFFILLFLFSNVQVKAGLEADIQLAVFQSLSEPFVEVNYYFVGSSIKHNQLDSINKQASLQIIIQFKQEEQIVKYDKYLLHSPLSNQVENFFDTKRYALQEGKYQVQIEIQNLADPNAKLQVEKNLEIEMNDGMSISDVQLLSNFNASDEQSQMVKNGYFMEVLPFAYYNMAYNQLVFYLELYRSNEYYQEDFVLSYQIFQIVNNKPTLYKKKFKRKKPNSFEAMLLNLDIADLPSGNFELEVALLDKNKKVSRVKRIPFKRNNPMADLKIKRGKEAFDITKTFVQDLDAEALRYSLRAIAPRIHSEDMEALNVLIRNKDVKYQRIFLYNFWSIQNQENPKKTYLEYMQVAKAVDEKFKNGFGPGFESDRGFVFLKYGKPDDQVVVTNETSTLPYEIWTYNTMDYLSQRNVRFLFYNTSLVPNGHVLLHSTAIGEAKDPQWQDKLFRVGSERDANAIQMAKEIFPEF